MSSARIKHGSGRPPHGVQAGSLRQATSQPAAGGRRRQRRSMSLEALEGRALLSADFWGGSDWLNPRPADFSSIGAASGQNANRIDGGRAGGVWAISRDAAQAGAQPGPPIPWELAPPPELEPTYQDFYEDPDAPGTVAGSLALPEADHLRVVGKLGPEDRSDLYLLPIPGTQDDLHMRLSLPAQGDSQAASASIQLVFYDPSLRALTAPPPGVLARSDFDVTLSASRLREWAGGSGSLYVGVSRTSAVLDSLGVSNVGLSGSDLASTLRDTLSNDGSSSLSSDSSLPYQLLIDRLVSTLSSAATPAGSSSSLSNSTLFLTVVPRATSAAAAAAAGSGSVVVPALLSLSVSNDDTVREAVAGKNDAKAPLKGAAPYGGVLDENDRVESLSGDALSGLDLTELPVQVVSDAFDPQLGLVGGVGNRGSSAPGTDGTVVEGDVALVGYQGRAGADNEESLWPIRHAEWFPAPILAEPGTDHEESLSGLQHERDGLPLLDPAQQAVGGTAALAQPRLDGPDDHRRGDGKLSLLKVGLSVSTMLAFSTMLPGFASWLRSRQPGHSRRRETGPFRSDGRPGSPDDDGQPSAVA